MPQANDENFLSRIETMKGDLRDFMLTHIRTLKKPWEQLSEAEQQNVIDAVTKNSETVIRNVSKLVASNGFDTVNIVLGKFTNNKGTVKLEVQAYSTPDNLTKLCVHGERSAVIVLTDAAEFMGQSSEAKPDPDEPELFEDDEYDNNETLTIDHKSDDGSDDEADE